jgi:hypothetical protein
MKKKFFQQQTPPAKHSVRYTVSFPVNVPLEKIDLSKWIKGMTDSDYTSYSSAHKAISSFTQGDKFYMTNVENIGTETLIQHYELKNHAANSIQLYSSKTRAYIMRWFPVTVGVPWELYVQPVSASSSRLICLIGVDYPNPILKIAAWFIGLGGFFLRSHLNKEGRAFAKDVEEKFKA